MDDDDDFGLDNTGDLELDNEEDFGGNAQANAETTGDSLFGGDDDGSDDHAPHRPPAGSARPSAHTSSHHHGSSSGGLFGDSANDEDDDLDLSGGDDFGGDLDIDHGPGPGSRQLPPRQPIEGPSRPPAPGPSRRRGSSNGLFSDSGNGDDDDLGLSGGDDYGGDVGIDPTPQPGGRPLPPPAAANFTDPSVSLDANDSDIADLLGPQTGPAAGTPAPPPLPPRPPAPQTISAPPPPLPDPAAGFGLAEEDSELAELLGDEPQSRPAAGIPRLPSPSAPPPHQPPARRISFQEPVARPLQGAASYRSASPAARGPSPDDDFGSVGDSGEGYGLQEEADREVARIAGSRGNGGDGRGSSFRPPAPQDSVEDDFGSGDGDDYDGIDRAMPPRPAGGASFRRIPSQGSAYSGGTGAADSPVLRDRDRGRPRGRVGGSSEAYVNYDDEQYDDEYEEDSMYDSRSRGDGGAKFRRVPAPGPGPVDEYDDEYDDEDDFADDVSWDGEIRRSQMSQQAGERPGSAGHPRSRGPHPIGTRRRAQSAMPPRERQAAMLEDMQRRHPSTWDIREVATWLEFIGMGQYRSKFVHHSVDGALLLSLGEPELARDMRILSLGHRRALLGAIETLKAQAEELEKQGVVGAKVAKTEAERVEELRRRAAEMQMWGRRPASAGRHVIMAEPGLGPAQGKITVHEQRAKLLYQLDKARSRAAQHAAIIDQLANNKALTDAQVAELRGKLKDLEAKHRDELLPAFSPGMAAPVTRGGGGGDEGEGDGDLDGDGGGGRRKGAAALAAAMYGEDAAIPWFPVGRGTRTAAPHPERYLRTGVDADVELTFQPRTTRVNEVPAGQVRDIVSKALGSRTPFWQRMDFEFRKMAKEREARDEARRKRRERMGVVKRGGGEGEDEEQIKSKYWNNYWVPGSGKERSYHKHFKRGSENADLEQYRSFSRDKERLSRWFKRFVDDDENTEGDVALERLVNRMIRALVKTKSEMEQEIGDSFDTRIRRYFQEHGYKFDTHTSNTIQVRARGTRAPAPKRPDNTMYDFEEVEQFYPDYLKKKVQGAQDDDEEEEVRMVPKRTTWKWLVSMYYMDRQKKLKSAIAMVKMAQFVQRHGAKWPPERDRDTGNKAMWVPNSPGGALHQIDGRDRTFNEKGRQNLTLQINRKKALGPEQQKTPIDILREEEAREAKAEALFGLMGWPHSSGDPDLGPPQEPLLDEGGGPEGGEEEGAGFGLGGDDGGGGAEGSGPRLAPRRRWAPTLDFFQAMDAMLSRAIEMRRMYDNWVEDWRRSRARGYGFEELSEYPPRVDDMNWSGDPLLSMQERAMERERQRWLLDWEKARRRRERQAARMRQEGYREEAIEERLGQLPDPSEVDMVVQNHLFNNVTLLSRLKPRDLAHFRDKMKGTKKKMIVYRALCNQMFLEETREKELEREESVRQIYESYRRDNRRIITPEEEEAYVERVQRDLEERQQRQAELKAELLLEEESSMTPWYLLPRGTRPPSQPSSRTTSPTTGRTRGRNPSPSPGPATRRTHRGSGGGAGADDVSASSRSKYVFGSSTPKSMWGPMGPVRQPRSVGRGTSLLDSPNLRMLQGGRSTPSVGASPSRTPRGAGRTSATRPDRGGRNLEQETERERGRGTATPTRQRPTTPRRSTGGGGGAGRGTPSPGRGATATPATPRTGATPTATPQRPGSAAASTATRTVRASGGGAPAAAAAAPSRRSAAVSQSAPSPPLSARGRPASPGGARHPPAPPASPRRTPARVGFATPPSPVRSSGGGGFGVRGRPSGGGAGPRRGLMDGDSSGTSASPSPERRPPVRGAPGAAGPPVGAGPNAATSAAARRGGLADGSDSSPSPQRHMPPDTPPAAVSARTGGGPPPSGQQSRRSSQASGVSGPAGGAAARPASRAGSVTGQQPVATPPPPVRQPSSQSVASRTPSRLSPQGSANSGLGLGAGNSGTTMTATTAPAGAPRGSGTGSATGSVGGGAAGSRRPSTATSAAPLEPQASTTSRSSSTSISISGRGGGSTGGGGGGSGSGAAGRSSSGTSTPPPQRSPLSRSPVAASPPASPPPPPAPPQQPGNFVGDDGGDGDGEDGVYAGEMEFGPDGSGDLSLTQGGDLDLGDDDLMDGAEVDLGEEEDEF